MLIVADALLVFFYLNEIMYMYQYSNKHFKHHLNMWL